MRDKIALKILAISIALLMLVSCATPCIAIDDHLSEVKRYSENVSISDVPQPFETLSLTESATLHFSYGWNAISAPVQNSTSMADLFVTRVPGFYVVWSWDSDYQCWVSEDLSQPLDPAKGYFIWATGDAEVELTGTPAPFNPPWIATSWNLIGVGFTPVNLTSTYAYWWNSSIWGYESTHHLEPGKGYFVWPGDDAGTLVPPNPENTAPVLVIGVSPISAIVSEEITVDTSGTYDDQYPLRIDCDWGDGTIVSDNMTNESDPPVFTHCYIKSGTYTITATATDIYGCCDMCKMNVSIYSSTNQPPNPPTTLAQFKSDSTTEISVGNTTDERIVILKGNVSDPDSDQVKLQVELRRLDEYGGQFDETKGGLKNSVSVENGSDAFARAIELIDADYHWRARAIDEHGEPSEWVDFGGNDISEADFVVSSLDQPPKASFTYSPENPKSGEWIVFDASTSEDDGEIVLYEWDWDNTGTINDRLADSRIIYYWDVSGTKQVRLIVTDNCGATSEVIKDINIEADTFIEKFKDFFKNDHKITKDKFKKIKERLNILNIPYPYPEEEHYDPLRDIKANPGSNVDLYWYRDDDLKEAFDKELLKEIPELNYGIYTQTALEEERFVEYVWNQEYRDKASVFFNTMLDINTDWSYVPGEVSWSTLEYALRDPYSSGVPTIKLFYDLPLVGVSINNLRQTNFYNSLYWYLKEERAEGSTHEEAWQSIQRVEGWAPQDYHIPGRSFWPYESETEYENKLIVLEAYYKYLWDVYGENLRYNNYKNKQTVLKANYNHLGDVYGEELRQNQLDEFRQELKNNLRDILYSVLNEHKTELLDYEVVRAMGQVELQVYDSQGNVTGVVSGEIKEEIMNSIYGDKIKTVVIFNSSDSYHYKVVGKDNGTYGLSMFSVKNGTDADFFITNISIQTNATHQYLVNWTALSHGEEGVTVQIDADGDGTFEQNITIQPPIANFTYSPRNPVMIKTITFNASNSVDKDGNITSYEWHFADGTNGNGEITAHIYALSGNYNVILTITDDDGAKDSIFKVITVSDLEENIFDTGAPANPYPSIMGNHTGTIKPNHTVIATKLYTYPCIGTGGHTEYARIWNKTWNATATWKGYIGDWRNITFDKTVVLLANETYDYTIRTGSYPQIHHNTSLLTANGWINCSQFVDANGKIYYDCIPAIKLFLW